MVPPLVKRMEIRKVCSKKKAKMFSNKSEALYSLGELNPVEIIFVPI